MKRTEARAWRLDVVGPAKAIAIYLSSFSTGGPAYPGRPLGPGGSWARRTPLPTIEAAGFLDLRQRLLAVLAVPLGMLLPSDTSILEWPGSLHPFQLEGVRLLLQQPEVFLADDMGLGKTVQAIAAFRLLLRRRLAESVLVIVPASLITQWRHELSTWAPELRVSTVRGTRSVRTAQWIMPAHVFLTTYETVRADHSPHPRSGPRSRCWGIVVLDEVQRIKNRAADLSAACKNLPRRRSWALSGTPLENSVDDLASIMEFLQPNPDGLPPVSVSFGPAMREMHARVQLRRTKREVLKQLPPKTVTDLVLPLTPDQQAAYDDAEREGVVELQKQGETLSATHVLSLITRLKQICNFCPGTGSSAKLDDVERRLSDLETQGHKMLVFTQFTDERFGVEAIVDRLSKHGALAYSGTLTQAERDEVIRRFKESRTVRALILSLRAGGQGLNLQDASYVVHFDRWWNPAVESQAEARSHRMGQQYPVNVYTYTMAGTIEERIATLLEEKRRLFKMVVDDVTLNLSRVLSATELFGLFSLPVPQSIRGDGRIGIDSFSDMSGREFEVWTVNLFRRLGFAVELTQASRDGGIDLMCRSRDVIGIETVLCVQCKNYSSALGVEPVRALVGCLPSGARGVMVCPSGFTSEAMRFGVLKGVQMMDAKSLASLVQRMGTSGTVLSEVE
ncbi:MAG: ATP-dependent helicase [Candidatus Latescibacteria bacterium]|nr:ATP-dependent helicase [Candidatus Latescibacterota bacterium]